MRALVAGGAAGIPHDELDVGRDALGAELAVARRLELAEAVPVLGLVDLAVVEVVASQPPLGAAGRVLALLHDDALNLAGMARVMRKFVQLGQRQGVHVGAQTNHPR